MKAIFILASYLTAFFLGAIVYATKNGYQAISTGRLILIILSGIAFYLLSLEKKPT